MRGRSHSEHARKVVHILFGAAALLLRYLAWWQAAAVALAAVLFNLLILPRLAPALFRPDDHAHRFSPGIAFYPLAVLLLIVAFPRRPDIAAAAWGILAFGDGMASVVGRRAGRRRLPWNREKSVEGTVAFFVSGAIAGVGLCMVVPAGRRRAAGDLVLDCCAACGGACGGAGRDDPDPARRQPVGAGGRRGGPVDGVGRDASRGRRHRGSGGGVRPAGPCRQRRRRRPGMARADREPGRCDCRRDDRHAGRDWRRLAGVGSARRDLHRGDGGVAGRHRPQDPARHRRGARRAARRRQRGGQHRDRGDRRAARRPDDFSRRGAGCVRRRPRGRRQ